MNAQSILDALPFPVYWLDSRKKVFKGANKNFLSSVKLNFLSELIDRPTASVFVGDYLRIINNLLNKSIKATDKDFSAVFHKRFNDHEKSILIQCTSITTKKESIAVF